MFMNTIISEPVIDISKLDCFNDQVFLDEFIDIFEDSAEELLDKLEKSLIDNFYEFKRVVHSIKGLSGNISASRLREVTTKAGGLSKEDYLKNAFEYSRKIVDEVTIVRKELAKCASKSKQIYK